MYNLLYNLYNKYIGSNSKSSNLDYYVNTDKYPIEYMSNDYIDDATFDSKNSYIMYNTGYDSVNDSYKIVLSKYKQRYYV